jgi:DNA end-binding protein Ku
MLDSRNHARVRYERVNEALRRAGMVGVARVVIRTRQYLAALLPEDDALMLVLMRYQQELRSPDEFDLPRGDPSEYGVSDKEMAMADQLIESMREEWRPERYRDEYRDRLMGWIERKAREGHGVKRKAAEPESEPVGAEVIDMMDLLKKSLANGPAGAAEPKKKVTKSRGSRKTARRRSDQ